MRRRPTILLLTVLLAPAGLRLSAGGGASEIERCAIACGHAVGVPKGAACCPTGNAPDTGPALKSCPRGGEGGLAPLPAGQPLLLVALERLAAPDRFARLDFSRDTRPRSAFLPPQDKVPLLAG